MKFKKYSNFYLCASVFLTLQLLSCVSAPPNPYDPSNTKIYLTLESSTGIISTDTLRDSVGNTIKIGITANLPSYVDSIGITVYSSAEANMVIDTMLKNLSPLQNQDTLWYKVAFTTSGKKALTATVFAGNYKNSTKAYINILDKPHISVPHSWPHLVINGLKNITVAQTCSLSVLVNDSNAGQAHTFYVKQDTLPLSAFTPPFNWTPPTGFIGMHPVFFKVTDTDSPAYFDTQTVTIIVSDDSIPPIVKHLTPTGDSITVSANSYKVSVICKDTSGIASVKCSSGADTFTTSRTDSIWSATITGLVQGQYKTVTFLATDMSARVNKTSLNVYIKYDSTLADNIGPIITKKSGPATNTRTANPDDTLVYSITDQSGVDTVSWTLNGGASTVLIPDTNGQYTIKAVLSAYHTNKIIITASDKSLAHNKSADTTILDYNVAPRAIDQNLSTKKNTALSVTLTADPIDGDTLSNWIVVTNPVNGNLSGTAPALTYTPKTDIVGIDSLTFTVSDGKNTSNVAKIKINVSDVLVAPVAGKTIADIAVNKGLAASFIATVNADANPSPVFSWFKDGSSTSLSANQTYTISQTNYSDQGRYRYIVSNSQGKDTSNWITLIVKDVTKPVIVLKGANPQQILVGGAYTELGDSAYDDKDGIITSRVVIDASKVKPAQIGTYPVTYAVKDSAGNVADTMTRSVQIYGNAPAISKISGNKETCINVPAIFSVTATGSQPIKFQWMKGTAAAPGKSTDSTYTITPISTADAGSFYCVVSNGISPDAQSQNMTLTVDSPPAISGIAASPSTMPVCQGTQVTFTVTATGTAPLTYSWKKNGTAIPNGPNTATYTINAVAASDSGQYSCTVSNGCSPAATSDNVQLTIKMSPTISAPTANTTISKIVGDTVTLTVTASGTGTLAYQWYKGSTTVGTNSSSYPIKPIAFADSGAYTCAVSNGCGTATSKVITLTVSSLPLITTQPLSQTLYLNQPDTFSVMATGVPLPMYVWKKNGVAISGQTGTSLIIASPGINDSGKYTVTVTNSAGDVTSDTARFYAGFKSVAGGGSYSLFLKTDGRLFGCGANFLGQLGLGYTTDQSSPILMTSDVQSVAAGNSQSLILKTGGILYACGYNGTGQLGDGTTTTRLYPVQIMTGVQSVAGGGHTLILTNNGTLFACGANYFGQFGDGSSNSDSIPKQIMTGVKSVSASTYHSLILKTDGTLFTCGNNSNGQLGNGTTGNDSIPLQIMTDVQSIAAGERFSLILKLDGTLLACGDNSYGQLGDGTIAERHSPVQIMTGVKSIAAGASHSMILKTDGTLFMCGNNNNGQLGNGNTTNQNTPLKIMIGVQSIAAGASHSLILKADGTLFSCGSNINGQLGDASMVDKHSPVNVTF